MEQTGNHNIHRVLRSKLMRLLRPLCVLPCHPRTETHMYAWGENEAKLKWLQKEYTERKLHLFSLCVCAHVMGRSTSLQSLLTDSLPVCYKLIVDNIGSLATNRVLPNINKWLESWINVQTWKTLS